MNFRGQDAVFMCNHAAHPDDRRDLVFGHTDALAPEVFRFLDARALADVDSRMAKNPRDKSRNADIGGVFGRDRSDVT